MTLKRHCKWAERQARHPYAVIGAQLKSGIQRKFFTYVAFGPTS